jgi:desulfoferrodoxin
MKNLKIYVCENCGNIISDMANADIVCCGRKLSPLSAKAPDEAHKPSIEKIEDDFYITFPHPMEKGHYISFISYVRFDRVLTLKLYPEQGPDVRFPQIRGGKMHWYCTNHGLFELKI